MSLTAADILEALDESEEVALDPEDLRQRYWIQHQAILSKMVDLAEERCPGITRALAEVELRLSVLDQSGKASA